MLRELFENFWGSNLRTAEARTPGFKPKGEPVKLIFVRNSPADKKGLKKFIDPKTYMQFANRFLIQNLQNVSKGMQALLNGDKAFEFGRKIKQRLFRGVQSFINKISGHKGIEK